MSRRTLSVLSGFLVVVSVCAPPALAGPSRQSASRAVSAQARSSAWTSGAVAKSACSLNVIYSVSGESAAADQRRTYGWTLLQASGWTVFVPSSRWTLAGGPGGADVTAPDGLSDASLGTTWAMSPWTLTSLSHLLFSQVTGLHIVCNSPVVRGSAATSQAVEFTGVYRRERIHGVAVLSVMTPQMMGSYSGQTRSIYTPASQWSAANEVTLMLIIKRAIYSPQSPTGNIHP